MATIASMNVDLTASTANFKAALDRAAKDMDNFGKRGKSMMDELKQAFGGRSAFKDVVELFKGGGAIVGLSLAFNGLADGLDALDAQMKKFQRTGVIAWEEVRSSIVKSIPVVGKFQDSLFRVIATYVEIQHRAKHGIPMPTLTMAGSGARAEEEIADSQSRLAEISRARLRDQEMLNAASDRERKTIEAKFRFESRLREISKAREAEIETIMKVNGIGNVLGGRAMAEGMLGARSLDFASEAVEAARQRDAEIRRANGSQAKSPFGLLSGAADGIKGLLQSARQRLDILGGATGVNGLNILRGLFPRASLALDALRRPAAAPSTPLNLPSPIQPAREFRFTEGIPGGRANPFERLEKATKDNERELRRNTEEMRKQRTSSTGSTTITSDLN